MISYLECFKPLSRLEGTLGAKIEVQIDLTFFCFDAAIAIPKLFFIWFFQQSRERTLVQLAVRAHKSYVVQGDYERLGD